MESMDTVSLGVKRSMDKDKENFPLTSNVSRRGSSIGLNINGNIEPVSSCASCSSKTSKEIKKLKVELVNKEKQLNSITQQLCISESERVELLAEAEKMKRNEREAKKLLSSKESKEKRASIQLKQVYILFFLKF